MDRVYSHQWYTSRNVYFLRINSCSIKKRSTCSIPLTVHVVQIHIKQHKHKHFKFKTRIFARKHFKKKKKKKSQTKKTLRQNTQIALNHVYPANGTCSILTFLRLELQYKEKVASCITHQWYMCFVLYQINILSNQSININHFTNVC